MKRLLLLLCLGCAPTPVEDRVHDVLRDEINGTVLELDITTSELIGSRIYCEGSVRWLFEGMQCRDYFSATIDQTPRGLEVIKIETQTDKRAKEAFEEVDRLLEPP